MHWICTLVTTCIDYANATLNGATQNVIHKLQLVQNTAARILTGTRKKEHLTPVLRELHWLPVNQRICFKILILTYKCISGQAPVYLCNLIKPYECERNTRSSSLSLLHVPFSPSHFSQTCVFSNAAPRLWNQLPFYIRKSSSLDIFKSVLKTHLFNSAFTFLS